MHHVGAKPLVAKLGQVHNQPFNEGFCLISALLSCHFCASVDVVCAGMTDAALNVSQLATLLQAAGPATAV